MEHYFIISGLIIGVLVYMDISNLEQSDTQIILCLFLAQNENPTKPHEQLGFKTAQGAFEEIGELFQKKENTVKNQRDAFDYYTDGPRVGWKTTLPPNLQLIFDSYGDLSRKELLEVSLDILEKQRSTIRMAQSNIFDVAAALDSGYKIERPDEHHIVLFSNSRTNKKWYSISVKQILQCLEDYKKPEFQNIDHTLPYSDVGWRDTHYDNYFSDKAMLTLAKSQGSAFYSLLAKLIQIANGITPVIDNHCPIDINLLDITIAHISNDMANSVRPPYTSSTSRQVITKTGGKNIIFYGPQEQASLTR